MSSWLQLAALALFLSFLVWLRYVAQHEAMADDKSRITTADFSLALTNLDASLPADELQRVLCVTTPRVYPPCTPRLRLRLWRERPGATALCLGLSSLHKHRYDDLQQLEGGAFRGAIHHVEVGRRCGGEMSTILKLYRLDEQLDEATARRAHAASTGHSTERDDERIRRLRLEQRAARLRMHALLHEEDMATGHAFVAFHLEADRNACAALFHRRGHWHDPRLRPPQIRAATKALRVPLRWWQIAARPHLWPRWVKRWWRGQRRVPPQVEVDAAPEPSEVRERLLTTCLPSLCFTLLAHTRVTRIIYSAPRCCGRTSRWTRSTPPRSSC